MSELRFEPEALGRLVVKYLEYQDTFGPFEEISREAAKHAESKYVWTGTVNVSRVLTNGFFESNEAFTYFLASKPCESPVHSLSFTTISVVDCLDCEATQFRPEGCEKCDWSGGLAFDFEKIVSGPKIDLASAEGLLSQAVALSMI